MSSKKYVMGLFRDQTQAVSAIDALKSSPWVPQRVHGPFPDHKILDALKLKKSPVGYFTLAGGILGFLAGFGLAIFTATRWSLIVSGKPVVALIPFFIVGFEFTILFAVLGNILGMLVLARLPEFRSLKHYDPRCSGEHFGILSSCDEGEQADLMRLFQEKGGEIALFDEDLPIGL